MFENIPNTASSFKAFDGSLIVDWMLQKCGFGQLRIHTCPITGLTLIDNEQVSRERVIQIMEQLVKTAVLTDNQEIKIKKIRITTEQASAVYDKAIENYLEHTFLELKRAVKTKDKKYYDLVFAIRSGIIQSALPDIFDGAQMGYLMTLRCKNPFGDDFSDDVVDYQNLIKVSWKIRENGGISYLPLVRAILTSYHVENKQDDFMG